MQQKFNNSQKIEFLIQGNPPFIKDNISINRIMFIFILCLFLPSFASIYFFGLLALRNILISVICALLCDLLMKKIRKKKIQIDGSEIITGILLALILPSKIPIYILILGNIFSIVLVKHAFGGLGNNIFNPALAGRAFLGLSWPSIINIYSKPVRFLSDEWFSLSTEITTVTSPTPLSKSVVKEISSLHLKDLVDPFLGNIPGSIGETSAVIIILAALILIFLKIIDWKITFSYVVTVFLGGFVYALFHDINGFLFGLYHIFTGGLLFGAVFMATDYVTTPSTKNGRIIFGIGCGFFTLLFRFFSSLPEGVCYSILIMNSFVPLIERYTFPKPFGWQKRKQQ